MSSEHRNRTNKAQAIAAALVTVGMPADGMLDEAGWRIAALAGWHIAKAEQIDGIAAEPWTTVSDATRTEVRQLLAADEARRAEDAEGLTAHRTDDVFASIAAGSVLPRPAQDPDRAPALVSVAGVVDLHPAARHTLNCLATSGGRTGCAC